MKNKLKQILSAAFYPLLLLLVVAAVWYIVAAIVDLDLILPTPTATIKQFFQLFIDGEFYSAFLSTLLRALIAFVASAFLAAILSVASTFFTPLYRFFAPLVSVLRSLPTMAVVLLLVIWTGARTAPVIVTSLVVLPTLYASFTEALLGVDKELIDVCRVCGGGKRALLLKVYIPLAAPTCSISLSANLSLSIKLTVAAEVLAATASSIGYMMQLSQIYFETARLMALTTATVIAAVVLEKLLYFILTRFFRT